MSYQGITLTADSIRHIHESETALPDFAAQVLSIKTIQATQPTQPTRYRLVVSDGVHYMQGIFL